jgi:dolichol-phosphate mannosyltransferase
MEFVSRIAFFTMLLSVAAIIFYILVYFFRGAPEGYITLLIIVLFLGSVQLLSLGIIGEYIAKIFEETKKRPRYITREIINNHKKT